MPAARRLKAHPPPHSTGCRQAESQARRPRAGGVAWEMASDDAASSTRPLRTPKATKPKQEAWAKMLCVVACIVEEKNGRLVTDWSWDEQSLKEEAVRTKVLLAAGTQSRVAGGEVHDVRGPPSKTIGHVIEGIIGRRLDSHGLWNGVSRSSNIEGDIELNKLEAEHAAVIRDAQGLSKKFMDAKIKFSRTKPTLVFQDGKAPNARCWTDGIKVVEGWQIVDWDALAPEEKRRRLVWLDYACEILGASEGNGQGGARLQAEGDFARKCSALCSQARQAFGAVRLRRRDEELTVCGAQKAELAALASPNKSSLSAEELVTHSAALEPLTSIVHKTATLMKTPGGVQAAKMIDRWVNKALCGQETESPEVQAMQQMIAVSDAWVAAGMTQPLPPETETLWARVLQLETENGVLVEENAALKKQNAELLTKAEQVRCNESASSQISDGQTKRKDPVDADATAVDDPLVAGGSPMVQQAQGSGNRENVVSPAPQGAQTSACTPGPCKRSRNGRTAMSPRDPNSQGLRTVSL